MKSKSISAKWIGALLGACLLLGAGLAQAAAPVCFAPGSPLQTSTMTVILGSPSAQWTATCNNGPVTAYVWKVGATTLLACTGATCIVPAANINAVGNYSVTVAAANQASGLGAQSPAATLTVTPVPSDCFPTYGSVDPINPVPTSPPLKQVTLTANCNPGADRSTTIDGYVWTAGGNPIPSADLISPTDTTPAITVKLSGEGMQYGVTNNTTVNSQRNSGAVFSGVPSCTLESVAPAVSGTAVTINSGASAVLMPTCDAATSIDWYVDMPGTADISIPSPAGGVVSPTATTAYYVVGNNAYGSSGSNVVTVTVKPVVPATPVVPAPLCSLTASPLVISVGDSTALTATCPGATSFTWASNSAGHGLGTPSFGNVNATPSSSGSKTYTVTGTNASGTGAPASVVVNVSATPKSDCTAITPATSSVAPSTATALTATCNNSPAATGYVWKLGTATLSCIGASCTVPATSLAAVGTYTVTVTNNNGGGAGASVSATITVSAAPKSNCTAITPATSSVAPSTATALTATCNNSPAATGYVWKLGTATLSCTGASCTVPAASLAVVGTYTATVTNNNGQGVGAAATATITVSATPKSDCTAITPATSSVAPSTATALTATCNSPAATGYVWKLGTATLSCTGASCTVPAASLAVVGNYTVTVTNNNGQGVGAAATATITVSATPTTCPQSIKDVQVTYSKLNGGKAYDTKMARGAAVAFTFTTDTKTTGLGSFDTSQSTAGLNVTRFVNISEKRCDFTYAAIDNKTGCARTSISTSTQYTLGTAVAGVCKLKPSTTYYVNVRNENAWTAATRGQDTCPTGQTCGYVANYYYPSP